MRNVFVGVLILLILFLALQAIRRTHSGRVIPAGEEIRGTRSGHNQIFDPK